MPHSVSDPTESATAPEPLTGSSTRWRLTVITIPALALVVLGWQRRWMADDAYIDLRVVHNILGGYGPVFNVGERVEAYTNPLWVGILTLWGWLGLSLPYGAVILGLLFSALGLIAAEAASLRLWRASNIYLASDEAIAKVRHPERSEAKPNGVEGSALPQPGKRSAQERLIPRLRVTRGAAPLRMTEAGSRRLGSHPVATSDAASDSIIEPNRRVILLPIGAIAFIAVPAVWDFATSGLETGLIFGWLGLSYWLLVRRVIDTNGHSVSRLREWLPVAVIFGLGPLIRPDLALWSGCFLLVMLSGYVVSSKRRGIRCWPGLLAIVGTAAGLPIVYELFRMAYFAALLPNTAYAKDAGGAYWSQGLTYLWDFVSIYDVFIPAILLMPLAARPVVRLVRGAGRGKLLAAVWLAPVAGALLDTLYVVRVGGDFMHARFLLPAFFGCLMPVMLVPVPTPQLRLGQLRPATANAIADRPTVAAIFVLIWAIGCAGWLRPAYAATPAKDGISNERAFYAHAAENGHPITPSDDAKLPFAEDGVWIHSLVEAQLSRQRQASTETSASSSDDRPGLVLINGIDPKQVTMSSSLPSSIILVAVRSALGLVSYIAGPRAFIVDRFGLADPIGSRLDVKVRGRPGHEKDLSNAWALARFADPTSPAAQSSEVKFAESALSCGAPHRLLQAIDQPLTLHRLLHNLRVAIDLHSLSIPENPQRAEAKFCRSS